MKRQIEADWTTYLLDVVPKTAGKTQKTAGKTQIQETKRAFFAGALAHHEFILRAVENKKDEEVQKKLDGIFEELLDFRQAVLEGRQ